jgi:hypothetical protein
MPLAAETVAVDAIRPRGCSGTAGAAAAIPGTAAASTAPTAAVVRAALRRERPGLEADVVWVFPVEGTDRTSARAVRA